MNEESHYETQDLCLASTLVTNDFQIAEIYLNGRKGIFCFEQGQELSNTINDYWEGRVVVEPKKFFHTIRNIKNRLTDLMERS